MKILFHLGYPRTGSTFLQTHIFPKHKQINFLGAKNYLKSQDVKITQNDLNLISEFYSLKGLKTDAIKKIDKKLIKYFDKKKINVISTERYLDYRNIINNFYDCKYLENLFKQSNVKIYFLIVLRNQYDLIKSYYFHIYPIISNFLRIKNFETLINFSKKDLADNYNNFPKNLFLRQYDFNYSHNKLSEKFKNCKIKYLFYEDLKFNKNIFCNQFSNFLNLDKEFTQKLFNNDPVNARKISKNKY